MHRPVSHGLLMSNTRIPSGDLLKKKRLIALLKISSPLEKLVVFIACLAIPGSAVATLHYAAVDLPQQKSQPTPGKLA